MERVVISGIGFVHSFGVGSSLSDLRPERADEPIEHALGGEFRMRHYDMPSLSEHPFHPDRKQLRYMRPDSVYALIAGGLALQDADLLNADHTDTSLFTGAGPCYSDMWPALQHGIIASMDGERFDIQRFGEVGMDKINPFFSIRSLAALPMAALAEKFGVRGENGVWGSFGAESAEAVARSVSDIQAGRAQICLAGGLDFLGHPHKIESIYFNDFYDEDLVAASGACFLVLESSAHNELRGGKRIAEISSIRSVSRAVSEGIEIESGEPPLYAGLFEPDEIARVTRAWVQPSGTEKNFSEERAAARRIFANAEVTENAKTGETLLAAAEPFGTAVAALHLSSGECAVSLSRSLCGIESGIMVQKGERRD